MIKKAFILGIIFLFPFMAFAQQSPKKKQKINIYLKFGAGLYWDISRVAQDYWWSGSDDEPAPVVNGQQIWIEGGIRLNDGLIITARIMHVTLEHYYSGSSYYAGQKYQYSIRNYAFGLGYEFKLGKHSRLMPQLDFTVNRTKSYNAYINGKYDNNGNLITVYPSINNYNDSEAGAVFNLDYYYQFKNKLFVGVRGGAYYVLGMDGITLTPIVGVKF